MVAHVSGPNKEAERGRCGKADENVTGNGLEQSSIHHLLGLPEIFGGGVYMPSPSPEKFHADLWSVNLDFVS